MTFIPHDIEPRTLYISKAGNDKADGDECPICLNTFEELTSRISALVPPPSQSDQAAAVSLARGRYDPVSAVEFPAWCQVDMPTVTIADGNNTSGATYKAASTSGVVVQGVTSTQPNGDAYVFDGTNRSGIEADAITSLLGGKAISMINGAEGSFCDIGQVICDEYGVYIDTLGARPSISNANILDMTADGAFGYYVKVADGVPCFMKGNAVRLAPDPFGGPTPTTATALTIDGGDTITYDYQLTQGDIVLNDGKSSIHIQHYKDGTITQNLGEHYFDVQILEGDVNAVGGRMVISAQEIVGDINQNSLSTEFSCSAQLLTGNLTLGAGVSTSNILAVLGNVETTSGIHYLTVPAITGNLLISGTSDTHVTSNTVAGDFTVEASALCTGQIDQVGGAITILGTFNGEIAGVKYGSWIEGSEMLATFTRPGNVSTSEQALGFLTIDTTTDTIDEITGSYIQNSAASRNYNLSIVDADDPLIVYFAKTNTDTGANIKFFDAKTAVTPLPVSQVVNLAIIQNRSGGGGLNTGNCQIEITRV